MNNKATIPAAGFGLWKVPKEQCAELVVKAIQAGYRHFDSASDYGNEAEVGEGLSHAIKEGLCTREELWITSKLWNTYHAAEHVAPALQKSLDDLQLEYVDLYLIHFPIALEYVPIEKRYPAEWFFDPEVQSPKMHPAKVPLVETWQAMELLHDAGKAKQIGVCNYNTALMHDLMSYARIKPAMLQVESHPYLTQTNLLRLCEQYEIPVTAFSPLGASSYVELDMATGSESVLTEPCVLEAAENHQRTAAQVILRWGVQRGTSVICKTSKPERMRENLTLFDFELSESEMNAISALDCGRRFNDPAVFCEAAFGTFHPIYD